MWLSCMPQCTSKHVNTPLNLINKVPPLLHRFLIPGPCHLFCLSSPHEQLGRVSSSGLVDSSLSKLQVCLSFLPGLPVQTYLRPSAMDRGQPASITEPPYHGATRQIAKGMSYLQNRLPEHSRPLHPPTFSGRLLDMSPPYVSSPTSLSLGTNQSPISVWHPLGVNGRSRILCLERASNTNINHRPDGTKASGGVCRAPIHPFPPSSASHCTGKTTRLSIARDLTGGGGVSRWVLLTSFW